MNRSNPHGHDRQALPAGPLEAMTLQGNPPVDAREPGGVVASVDLAEQAQRTPPGRRRWLPMVIDGAGSVVGLDEVACQHRPLAT